MAGHDADGDAHRLVRAAKLLDVALSDAVARGSQLGFALASLFRSYLELVAGRVGDAEAEAANALRAADGIPRIVAGDVADGMSNREIAQSLFVTTRTVETHLSSVYRKLGRWRPTG